MNIFRIYLFHFFAQAQLIYKIFIMLIFCIVFKVFFFMLTFHYSTNVHHPQVILTALSSFLPSIPTGRCSRLHPVSTQS